MPEKGNEKKDIKLKKPTEVSFELEIVNEQETQNSSEDVVYRADKGNSHMDNFHLTHSVSNNQYEINLENVNISAEYTDDAAFLKMYTISNMREELASGKSVHEIYNNMKDYILANKDTNPDNVQRAIAQLLGDAEGLYDDCIHRSGLNLFLGEPGYHRENLGNNGEEILNKVLAVPEGETLHGFVCSTISEFGMRLLDECGIKSAMLCGGSSSGNHTILLWQREDGKYVYTNYKHSGTIDATNIKDAAREIYKHGLGLINNGYMYIVDGDDSYQQETMEEEAVWGYELDKRDYNNQNIFSHQVADKPAIDAKVQVSGLGSISAEVKGTLAYGNDVKSKETSLSIGYKKSNGTALADNSTSIGAKIEHLGETLLENGKKFFGTKVIADLTTLNTNQTNVQQNYFNSIKSKKIENEEQIQQLRDFYSKIYQENYGTEEEYIEHLLERYSYNGVLYINLTDENEKQQAKECFYDYVKENYDEIMANFISEEDFIEREIALWFGAIDYDGTEDYSLEGISNTYLTTFVRTYLGKEKVLLNDGNIRLTNGYKAEGILGFSLSTSSIKNFGGDARVSGEEGLKLDVAGKQSLFSTNISGGIVADFALKKGTLTPTVSPGIKLNGGASYQARLNDNVSFGAGADGYAVVTKPSVDYGASGYIQAAYKPESSNVTIFGGVNYGIEKQNLRVGGFNEQTENTSSLGVSLGAQIGGNTRVSFNYNNINNKLNATRSREIFSVSANVSL